MQGLQPWGDGGAVYVGRCPTLVCVRLSALAVSGDGLGVGVAKVATASSRWVELVFFDNGWKPSLLWGLHGSGGILPPSATGMSPLLLLLLGLSRMYFLKAWKDSWLRTMWS